MSIRQFAPKRLDDHQPSLDQIIEARVAGLVSETLAELRAQIAGLEAQIESDTVRWPERMYRGEAAEYLGVDVTMLDRLVREGHIPTVQLPGMTQRSYLKSDLNAYLRSTNQ